MNKEEYVDILKVKTFRSPSFVIKSANIFGNLHDATKAINKSGLADYLFALDSVSGSASIAIFKIPKPEYDRAVRLHKLGFPFTRAIEMENFKATVDFEEESYDFDEKLIDGVFGKIRGVTPEDAPVKKGDIQKFSLKGIPELPEGLKTYAEELVKEHFKKESKE